MTSSTFAALTIALAAASGALAQEVPAPQQRGEISPALSKQIDEERERLSKGLIEAAKNGEAATFTKLLGDAMDRFPGDPATILEKVASLLDGPSPTVRLELSNAFLRAGFQRDKALTTFMDILKSEEKLEVGGDDGEKMDLRIVAAGVLAREGVREAANPIWLLYRVSGQEELLTDLARLGDRRPLESVERAIKRPGGVIGHAEIAGLLKFEEARKPLEEVLKNRALQASPPDGDQFAAEWALYRITGEAQHLDYLIRFKKSTLAKEWLGRIKEPKVEQLYKGSLLDADNNLAEFAFLGLHIRYRGSAEVRLIVANFLKGMPKDHQLSVDAILRVAVDLRDPEIDELGWKWAREHPTGSWMYYYNRRNWPFRDSRFP